MFIVKDDGRPAKYPEIKVHPSWNKCEFETFQEALVYANKWLGDYGGEGDDMVGLELNVPWDYSGCGSFIVIEEIK